VISIILIIALYAFNNHLQSNQTKILDQLPFLNHGAITFEKAKLDVWQNFPKVAIALEGVQVKDSLTDFPLVVINKLTANASLQDLLDEKVSIQSVDIQDGVLNISTDNQGYSNIKSLFQKNKTQSSPKKENNFQVILDQLQVQLSNFEVHLTDAIKGTSIHGTINLLETSIAFGENKNLDADIEMELAVQELAFKKQNGSFVENSQLKGKFSMSSTDGNIKIPPFDLKINEEVFVFHGNIFTTGEQLSDLNFENKNTRLAKAKPLLPAKIQKVLKPYEIEHPFHSKTTIKSTFKPGFNPLVTIDFDMKENDLSVFNIPLNQTSLKGRFINRLYDDERNQSEKKGNIRLMIENFSGTHGDFSLQSETVQISSTKATGPKIKSSINIKGNAKGMGEWLENDQFFFEKGDFNLTAHVNGLLKDVNNIIVESDAQLLLNDFSVFYQPSKVAFPFQEMKLEKKVGDAFFTLSNDTFVEGHHINIDGGLKNLPALLVELSGQQTSSEINIVANRLSWQEFLDLFGENGYLKNDRPKTQKEKKKSMKATIMGIENNFQPRVTFQVKNLEYTEDIFLKNFRTGVHFEHNHTLVLENTHFEFDGSSFDLNARIDISDPERTPFSFNLDGKKINLHSILPKFDFFNVKLLKDIEQHPDDVSISVQHQAIIDDHKGLIHNSGTGKISIISNKNKKGKIELDYQSNFKNGMPLDSITTKTQIYLEGEPIAFNDFFKTEEFFFRDGLFKVKFDYEGDFYSVKNLLENSKTTFSLTDSEVVYQPVEVAFPLTKIEVTAHDNHADFNFLLHHDSLDRELIFLGKLENLSELVLGKTGKQVHTDISIHSPKILTDELMFLFQKDTKKEKAGLDQIKNSVLGLMKTFDPIVHVTIDTLQYADLVTVENLETGIHLNDSSTLVLEKTGFDFHNGNLNFNGEITLNKISPMPFKFQLQSRDFDLGGLLEELEYLSIPVLKDMEKLNGIMTMNLDLKGQMQPDGKGIITKATNGTLDFDFKKLEIKGLTPLDSIANKLKMKHRFADVQFAPISDKIFFKGENIGIPLMEIQSTALHLFLEGNFSFGDATNLWIAVPLDNLKHADRTVIPKKLGYAAAKHKVYLEAFKNKEGKFKIKFHPTKKKYYKDRGILHQYKEDKKRDKAIRKAMRKGGVLN